MMSSHHSSLNLNYNTKLAYYGLDVPLQLAWAQSQDVSKGNTSQSIPNDNSQGEDSHQSHSNFTGSSHHSEKQGDERSQGGEIIFAINLNSRFKQEIEWYGSCQTNIQRHQSNSSNELAQLGSLSQLSQLSQQSQLSSEEDGEDFYFKGEQRDQYPGWVPMKEIEGIGTNYFEPLPRVYPQIKSTKHMKKLMKHYLKEYFDSEHKCMLTFMIYREEVSRQEYLCYWPAHPYLSSNFTYNFNYMTICNLKEEKKKFLRNIESNKKMEDLEVLVSLTNNLIDTSKFKSWPKQFLDVEKQIEFLGKNLDFIEEKVQILKKITKISQYLRQYVQMKQIPPEFDNVGNLFAPWVIRSASSLLFNKIPIFEKKQQIMIAVKTPKFTNGVTVSTSYFFQEPEEFAFKSEQDSIDWRIHYLLCQQLGYKLGQPLYRLYFYTFLVIKEQRCQPSSKCSNNAVSKNFLERMERKVAEVAASKKKKKIMTIDKSAEIDHEKVLK